MDGRRLDASIGTGWALITMQDPAPSAASALAARDCIVVRASPGGNLAVWLGSGQATAALVRPDRTVLASSSDVTQLCALLSALVAPHHLEAIS